MTHPSNSIRGFRWARGSTPGLATALAAAVLLLMSALPVLADGGTVEAAKAPKFNRKGNVLIADQFNNRVIEVSPGGTIVFTAGDGSSIAGPNSFVAPNDAQRVGSKTLIAATGAPPGAESTCPGGCPDNRVVLVDKRGQIVWAYGVAGVTGSDFNQLNAPVQATYLPNGHVLITDQGNQRVIEVKKNYKIAWQYGTTGVAGSDANQLNDPNSAELLDNGNILIADEGNNRVIEVNRNHDIVWSAGGGYQGESTSSLVAPAFASRLPNGDTLISDSGNNRIVELDTNNGTVWQVSTATRSRDVPDPEPTRAVRLKTGNTLISDQFNHQVIEVDTAGNVVWSYGTLAVPGSGPNMLNAPYDAKKIGDYTGLTKPPAPSSGGSGSGGGGYGMPY
jgi:hypothetical protein